MTDTITTEEEARTIKTPGRHKADGHGLYLNVSDKGAKSWVQCLTVDRERRNTGLGSYGLVTLQEARILAYQNRKTARAGGDPIGERRERLESERRRRKCPTVRETAEVFIRESGARWKSDVTRKNWQLRMDKYVLPKIGDKRIDRVTQKDVLNILVPIWTEKNETARKCRQFMADIFRWAMSHEYRPDNPAGEAISGALLSRRRVENMRALPWQDVPAAMDTIRAGMATAATLALQFVILTACRNGEARKATWQEIDLETSTWTIPGDRMKAGKEHRVPLTGPALAVLEKARILDDGSGLIFPSPRKPGNPLSDMALTKILRNTGLAEKCVVHGFRASFKSWSLDTGKARDVTEMCLAHAVGGAVEMAYSRTDALDRRRLVMAQWADYLTGQHGAVVKLRA